MADLERIATELDGGVVIEIDLSQPGAGADLAARAIAALGGVDIHSPGPRPQRSDEGACGFANYM